jgi:predicted component of type VI protein secretion system
VCPLSIKVHPIRLAHPDDNDGALTLYEGALVAVASRLSSEHGDLTGYWNVAYTFGVPYGTTGHDRSCLSSRRSLSKLLGTIPSQTALTREAEAGVWPAAATNPGAMLAEMAPRALNVVEVLSHA